MSRQIKFLYSKYNQFLKKEKIDYETFYELSTRNMVNCASGTKDFLDKFLGRDFVKNSQEIVKLMFECHKQRKYNVYGINTNIGFENKAFYLNENKVNREKTILYKGLILYRAE